ncbi:MAG: LapA family protein [Desulfamplus sp.]|nr:LapA family protein [Desulfamplus sp.]MBF0240864.1 LapA family protein [Desulfamplus sp.]MBF0388959.1 LapA family protein [Desulfamplus sp.]
MKTTLKILGIITGFILVGSLMIMNSQPVKVDMVFVNGEVSCFVIVIASFLAGYITCLIYQWLKSSLRIEKKNRSISAKPADIFGDI